MERLYGIVHGNNRYEKNSSLKTQDELASNMDLDVRTLQNYKILAEMIPELYLTTKNKNKYIKTLDNRTLIRYTLNIEHEFCKKEEDWGTASMCDGSAAADPAPPMVIISNFWKLRIHVLLRIKEEVRAANKLAKM